MTLKFFYYEMSLIYSSYVKKKWSTLRFYLTLLASRWSNKLYINPGIYIWVARRASSKKQEEQLALCEYLCSSPVFGSVHVVQLFSCLCCVVFVCFVGLCQWLWKVHSPSIFYNIYCFDDFWWYCKQSEQIVGIWGTVCHWKIFWIIKI